MCENAETVPKNVKNQMFSNYPRRGRAVWGIMLDSLQTLGFFGFLGQFQLFHTCGLVLLGFLGQLQHFESFVQILIECLS